MSQENGKGYYLPAGEGVAGFDASVKAGRASTNGALTLIESRTTGGAPLHVHTREDECLYVVEGRLTVQCGDESFEAEPRSFVFLPRGVPHAWDVLTEEATVLMITVPPMLEEFLQEFHSVQGSGRREVAEKYGITFVSS